MRTPRITALLGTVLLTGCATSLTAPGHGYYLTQDRYGRPMLVSCGLGPCNTRVTNDPHDEEFWQFEARLKIRSVSGIPYGREPRDYNVIGSRDRCEDERVHWIARSIPTELCRGPFFFRRDPAAEAAQGSTSAPVQRPPVIQGGVVVPGTPGIYGGSDELGLSQLFLRRPYADLGGAGTFVRAPTEDNSWGTSPYTDLQAAQIVDFAQGLGPPADLTVTPLINYAGAPYAHGVAGGPADFADQFSDATAEKFRRQNEDLLGRR
jgi:hypothetical protein